MEYMKIMRWILAMVLMVNLHPVFAQGYRNDFIQRLDEEYTSSLFRGGNALYLVPPDDPGATGQFNIFNYLQGRVPGLTIYNPFGMRPYVSLRNARPAFFLDELRVDAGTLNIVSLQDIALIKIFRPPFIGAPGNGAGGAIAVYTIRGEEEE